MHMRDCSLAVLLCLLAALATCAPAMAAEEIKVLSPDGNVRFQAAPGPSRLAFSVWLNDKPVIEASPEGAIP